MRYVILNQQLVEADKALVSIQDRGFRFGDGVFETIAVQGGVPYQFDWHMERLRKGLHAVRINANLHTLHEQSRRLLKENEVKEGVLRIQVTRGAGSRGYLPDPTHPRAGATMVMETLPLPALPQGDVTLCMSSYRKISATELPVQYKLCQGLNATLARMEAAEQGHFDALMENVAGQLCEVSSGNIFWLKDGALHTPALLCGVLEGSMRAALMRLSPLPVYEVQVPTSALEEAECVFICNAVLGVAGVSRIAGLARTWPPHAMIATLKTLVQHDRDDYTQSHALRW
jgi:branched-subunit amino acid aminotransferase/4-amino-4-deoxychorismate lyase